MVPEPDWMPQIADAARRRLFTTSQMRAVVAATPPETDPLKEVVGYRFDGQPLYGLAIALASTQVLELVQLDLTVLV